MACRTKEGTCKARSVVYQIDCMDCLSQGVKSQYLGETHRTLWDRLEEHCSGLESQLKSNALVKHWTNFHQEKPEPPKYQAKKLGTYLSSTERQIREAMVIQRGIIIT